MIKKHSVSFQAVVFLIISDAHYRLTKSKHHVYPFTAASPALVQCLEELNKYMLPARALQTTKYCINVSVTSTQKSQPSNSREKENGQFSLDVEGLQIVI